MELMKLLWLPASAVESRIWKRQVNVPV
jgi:hypothetical protein